MSGWIGVDLDRTLAFYDEWRGPEHIGEPIPTMVARVKEWLAQGQEVRIFTARVSDDPDGEVEGHIRRWCVQHLGCALQVTNCKDYGMIELWDDRAVAVVPNTGIRIGGPR